MGKFGGMCEWQQQREAREGLPAGLDHSPDFLPTHLGHPLIQTPAFPWPVVCVCNQAGRQVGGSGNMRSIGKPAWASCFPTCATACLLSLFE